MSLILNEPIYNVLHSNLHTTSKYAPNMANVACKTIKSPTKSPFKLKNNSIIYLQFLQGLRYGSVGGQRWSIRKWEYIPDSFLVYGEQIVERIEPLQVSYSSSHPHCNHLQVVDPTTCPNPFSPTEASPVFEMHKVRFPHNLLVNVQLKETGHF